MELEHRGALVSGSIPKPSLPCMLNVTHQPLSFAICIMRPLKSVTAGPPATPAHFILQRPVSVTPKRFHMSTLTWLLIFCLQNAASQPLDGLPKALEHTAFLGPLIKGPLQQKHNTQGGGPCGNISLPSLLGSQQRLRTMWVYLRSAGRGVCYHSQGTPSPVLTAYSGPSGRCVLQALSGKEVSLLLSYHQGFPIPREVSGFREMKKVPQGASQSL